MKNFKRNVSLLLFTSGLIFATDLPNPQPPAFISNKTVKVMETKAQMEKVEKRAEYDITRMDGYKMAGKIIEEYKDKYLVIYPSRKIKVLMYEKWFSPYIAINHKLYNCDSFSLYLCRVVINGNPYLCKIPPSISKIGGFTYCYPYEYINDNDKYSWYPPSETYLYATPQKIYAEKKCYYIRNPQTGEEQLIGCKLEFKNSPSGEILYPEEEIWYPEEEIWYPVEQVEVVR